MRLYTIGFTQKSAKVFFEILKKHEVQLLIDIRLKPDGQLAGFTKKNDLPYFLVNLASGCLYEHAPDLAPTKEILKDYRNDGNWQLYVDRFEALMDDRGIPEKLDRTKFESLSKNVEEIFGQPIRTGPGHFVLDGQGSRSLGTIRPNRIIKAIYEQEPGGSIRYRLGFEDDAKDIYWLSVTDLTWRYYCDFQRRKGLPYQKIGNALTGLFLSNEVYIRISLARSWAKYPERCYLQVTGIYSFPDYLEGKLFSDFYIKE